MIRLFGKATILALAALSATAAVNCSSNSNKTIPTESVETNGTVGLNLDVGGVTISSVTYTISGPGGFSQTGSIDVANSTEISTVIGGLPAGTGYTITLSASNADAGVSCIGAAQFDVIARTTTSVTVHLTCQRPKNTGSVLVNGTINLCPVIDSVSATAAVAGSIQLSSSASDLDHAPLPLAFHWDVVSGPGTLSNANISNPKVNCTAQGTVNLKLTVTDGDATTNCPDVFTTSVSCPAAAVTTVGAGGAAGAAGAAGSAGAGGAAGAGVGGSAGAGVGGAAGAGVGGAAGAGVGGAAGSAGAAGAGGSTPVDPICGGMTPPKMSTPSVCAACEDLFCPHDPAGCPTACSGQPACSDYGVTDGPLCDAVLKCIRRSNCIANGTTFCYCGNATLASCQAGMGTGACKAEIQAALKSTADGANLLNLTNVRFPGGGAMSLGQCDHDNCGDPNLGGDGSCVPYCK